ncbi:unnamed protein product [Effrenium voratum]|nr:unnamed protein product [Effrenium voratum]
MAKPLEQTLKFEDEQPWQQQELWWDLAKTFVVPVPVTTAELEPVRQRICSDRSFLLSILKDNAKCSYSWQALQFVNEELRNDRDVFIAAIGSQAQGWKSLKFAGPTVREDAMVCHEAVAKNVAAMEFVPLKFRNDGKILSLWLSIAMQKAHQKMDNRFEKHWKAQRGSNTQLRKRVRMQEVENVSTERVVPLAALCVQCASRCILVAVGSYDPATRTAFTDLKYPGVKVKHGESPYDAAARLCKTRLASLAEYIEVETSSFDAKEEEDISKRTGQPSRYLRTIFRGHMSSLVPWAQYVKFVPSRLGCLSPKLTSKQNSLARRYRKATATVAPMPPDIFAFKQDLGSSEITLYAWVPAWEFEHLRYTAQGEGLVDFWVHQGDFSVLHGEARNFTPGLAKPQVAKPTVTNNRSVLSAQKIANLARQLANRREMTNRKYTRVSVMRTD